MPIGRDTINGTMNTKQAARNSPLPAMLRTSPDLIVAARKKQAEATKMTHPASSNACFDCDLISAASPSLQLGAECIGDQRLEMMHGMLGQLAFGLIDDKAALVVAI